MPSRSNGMHIHGTRVGAVAVPAPSDADLGSPGRMIRSRRRPPGSPAGMRVERLEHLHLDFELEQRFSRRDTA